MEPRPFRFGPRSPGWRRRRFRVRGLHAPYHGRVSFPSDAVVISPARNAAGTDSGAYAVPGFLPVGLLFCSVGIVRAVINCLADDVVIISTERLIVK